MRVYGMDPVEKRRFFTDQLRNLVNQEISIDSNFGVMQSTSQHSAQQQTNEAFSDKWVSYEKSADKEAFYRMQKSWYLDLYGFADIEGLKTFLQQQDVIFDAGCGLGYKSAWLAELAPDSLVVGMDFSEAARRAAENFGDLPNLFFLRGDISNAPFADGSVDYVNCDQVIQHTEYPDETFAELVRLARRDGGQIACYFYAQKALPRELLDDYFRVQCSRMSKEELWALSEQLTELGKRLTELNARIDVPAIPALGIKGGNYDVQRFIYWNFLKCYWSATLGHDTSVVTNYDWYSPSNARRYSKDEVLQLAGKHGLSVPFFHEEEACYSGRFVRQTLDHDSPLLGDVSREA